MSNLQRLDLSSELESMKAERANVKPQDELDLERKIADYELAVRYLEKISDVRRRFSFMRYVSIAIFVVVIVLIVFGAIARAAVTAGFMIVWEGGYCLVRAYWQRQENEIYRTLS